MKMNTEEAVDNKPLWRVGARVSEMEIVEKELN